MRINRSNKQDLNNLQPHRQNRSNTRGLEPYLKIIKSKFLTHLQFQSILVTIIIKKIQKKVFNLQLKSKSKSSKLTVSLNFLTNIGVTREVNGMGLLT